MLLLSPFAAIANDTITTTNGNSSITGTSNMTTTPEESTARKTLTTKTTFTSTEEITRTKTSASTTKSPQKTESLCKNYATITDDSRLFLNPSEESNCEFYFRTAVRFISSDRKDLQLKENCSNEEVNQLRYYCGSSGLTYMEQSHPDISDVPTQVSICVNTFIDYTSDLQRIDIFPRPDCKCNSRQNILVQNCSGFYVYQIVPISFSQFQCTARYCTEEISKCRFTTSSTSSLIIFVKKLKVELSPSKKIFFLLQ